jgi:hypothetical protein
MRISPPKWAHIATLPGMLNRIFHNNYEKCLKGDFMETGMLLENYTVSLFIYLVKVNSFQVFEEPGK